MYPELSCGNASQIKMGFIGSNDSSAESRKFSMEKSANGELVSSTLCTYSTWRYMFLSCWHARVFNWKRLWVRSQPIRTKLTLRNQRNWQGYDYFWPMNTMLLTSSKLQKDPANNLCDVFNSLAPGRGGSYFETVISRHMLQGWFISTLVKLLQVHECHRTPLMISHHWFR